MLFSSCSENRRTIGFSSDHQLVLPASAGFFVSGGNRLLCSLQLSSLRRHGALPLHLDPVPAAAAWYVDAVIPLGHQTLQLQAQHSVVKDARNVLLKMAYGQHIVGARVQ